MFRSFTIAAASAAALALSTAFAADHGTADEAKAMLLKTVAAIKADKAKTIDLINKGEGGFLDRDLYPFCSNISDGKNVALGNPNAKQLLGVDVRTTKDVNGKAFDQSDKDCASFARHYPISWPSARTFCHRAWDASLLILPVTGGNSMNELNP